METGRALAEPGRRLPGRGFLPVGVQGGVQRAPGGREVFVYIFLALAWMLTSQKERALGAVWTYLFPFAAQLLLPVPCHSTVTSDATSVSYIAEREKAPSSAHCYTSHGSFGWQS